MILTSIESLYLKYIENPIICTDSRNVVSGCIFFALKGDNFNGNLYASDAIAKGASYAVVDDLSVGINERFLFVSNVLETLQQLANFHRRKLGIKIFAITGTNGKTTTKELFTAVFTSQYKVCATKGNLNNHIGVPLTLLSMDKSHEIGIVEMGANHIGEIEQLCKIAEPDYGMITNIGKAHLEGFGSFEGVIKAKTEMYSYLSSNNGVVFVNSDNSILTRELNKFPCKKILYGEDENNFCSGKVTPSSAYMEFSFIDKGYGTTDVHSNLIGSYNFENALAACCAGLYYGISSNIIKNAIEKYFPNNNRSQLVKTKSNVLLLDYYNANPSSMDAALRNFAAIDSEGKDKVILLGEMRELGDQSNLEHKKVADLVEALGFSKVYYVGDEFAKATNNAKNVYNNSIELLNYLNVNKITNSLLLIKGSRGTKMENVIECLQN